MTLARCCRELLALVEIPRGWGGQIDATHAAYPLTSVDYPDAVQNPLFYCNGALALHELNGLLGDDAFWTLLREYTSAERSSARHFVNLLRERRPGPDTEAYLDRWFR